MTHVLDRFMNDVRVRLPGALDDAIKLEFFAALDEFCKETNAWQEKIPLPVYSSEKTYEIEPEENRAIIVRLLGVGIEDENGVVSGWGSIQAALPTPDTIVFRDAPPDQATYVVDVALSIVDPVNVSDGLPQFPDWFLTNYSQELLDGVLSKMMSQQAKPYTSRDGFLYHGRRFRNHISAARSAVNYQSTYGAQAWRFPAFAQCNTR